MLKLTDRQWRGFVLGDLFDVKRGSAKGISTLQDGGQTALISALDNNNGFYMSTETTALDETYSHMLTVNNNGNGVCLSYYHAYDFVASTDVSILQPKISELSNKYIALFISNMIKQQKQKYCYGYKMSNERMRKQTILLPVTDSGTPDFEFMQQYMREHEAQKLQQYIAYAQAELMKMQSDVDVETVQLTWKDFCVEDVFDIVSGKDAVLTNNEGDIPYVNSSGVNNGITCFVKSCPVKVKNCITIARTGTVGSTFYQENEVGISGNIRALSLKDRKLNKEIAQFLITALKNSIEGNFDYGKILGTERIKNLKIKLPVTTDGSIDYKYMEAYIYIYIDETAKVLRLYQRCNLKERKWNSFDVEAVFQKIQRGKRLIKENQVPGLIPYISSSGMNNGVDNFIANTQNVRQFGHCLSLANSGSVGSCFYQPFPFVASDHITHLKGENLTKCSYLFLATILGRLSEKYNFNREINDARIANEKIMLPSNVNQKPDYEFMGQYIRNVIIEHLFSVLHCQTYYH